MLTWLGSANGLLHAYLQGVLRCLARSTCLPLGGTDKTKSTKSREKTIVQKIASATTIALFALVFTSCTTQQAINVATARNPSAALKNLGNSKVEAYKRDPRALVADFDRLQQELERLFGQVRQESEKKWGKEESEQLPAAKRYVKYTEQYRNRIVVDYEKLTIRVEHLQEPGVVGKLRTGIVTALLTPDDPRLVDVFSDKEIPLEGKPFLQDLVLDQDKRPMRTREDVERYATFLTSNRLKTRKITVGNTRVDVAYVQFDMIGAEPERVATAPPPVRKPAPPARPVPGRPTQVDTTPDARADERRDINNYSAADKVAPRYLALVNKYAEKTQVDPALIFAIIYQESRFNPYAVSSAQAYGMMQLVPKSGGLDAFRKAKGESVQPTKDYLMDPENNIELGATYINILLYDAWTRGIVNFPSREYCAISGYNTGPGNVARAFSGSPRELKAAEQKANAMRADEVFDHLRAQLPYHETRDYLVRVAAARRHYHQMFYANR